ncbi:MAG: hypothetical protein N3A01_07890, partial [Bacteroidales bacterium]|nr:hypothetical protein [Bacteroidales bacterium]
KQYAELIKNGDNAFSQNQLHQAKQFYTDALKIKPNEQYPKDKIAEINEITNKLSIEMNYKLIITQADSLFEKNNLTEARSKYEQALKIKPNEQYPKNKIIEIENLLFQKQKKEQEIKEREQNYKENVAKGDDSFNKKDYNAAITYYTYALNFKPNDQYCKNRIIESQSLLKKQKEEEEEKLALEKQKQIEEMKAKMKKLEEIDFSDKENVQKYLSELARTYPEGITEENYEDNTKKIKRIIVNKNGVANEYREVIHSWGGVYYFKNGQSISKSLFSIETKKD